ncbi:MAG TPA: alpha/beta family hydrolase [Longimicrobiales bacterium]|nr:alpha/beta family hydrolase [Longimicrobiales bacterium]
MTTEHRFVATDDAGEVTGLLAVPREARLVHVFAHGAGAGMRHAFMEAACWELGLRGIATFRYQFPYMEAGRRAPNPGPVLMGTVRSAVAEAARLAPGLPLVAGGKSMGGRMTSLAAAEEALPEVRGLAFFGFPLHGAGKAPSAERGAHLADVGLPMLFLQGDRDSLADLSLLEPLLSRVHPRPVLHVEAGADHGFHVLKRSGRTDEEVLRALCDRFAAWADDLVG